MLNLFKHVDYLNLVRSASSFFDVNVKKLKDPGDEFGPYTILEELY